MVSATRDLDLARMHRDRLAKLQAQMTERGIGALVLVTSGSVMYATGARWPHGDNSRTYQLRTTAVVVAGDNQPHLFTPFPEGAPAELAADHVHRAFDLETEAGIAHMAGVIKDIVGGRDVERIGIDDYTAPMWFHLPGLLEPAELVEAAPLLVDARLHKTADEVECMRRSWEINEAAHAVAERLVRPGTRLTELSGAFLRTLFEQGASCNFLDPVFQAMPDRISDGPYSTNGDVPFNLLTTDHVLSEGDVIWTDCVTGYEGYASDVGRTWVVGPPSPTLTDLYRRWQEITDAVLDRLKPGVAGSELTAIATELNGGTKPWIDHFFLGHTLGLEGGETQHIGSDKGPKYDEKFILEPGMAIVIEPVTWTDGHKGWRCEELVIITEDGHDRISHYPNEPFE